MGLSVPLFRAPCERVGTGAKQCPAAKEGGAEGLMARGTVKWFSEEKGYGFVAPDEGGEDLFVHYSAIEGEGYRSLEEGERVSYEPTRGRKGEQAENVRRVE